MALREEFKKQGAWLFRWRSYLPFVAIPLVTYGLTQSEYLEIKGYGHQQMWWEIFSVSVSVAGFLIRCITVGWIAKGTSGRNTHGQVAEFLNTTGIYSVVRHPLYLGNFLLTLGFLLFTQVLWLIAISVLLFWLYYERIMYTEEDFLREKFGVTFENWANRTPAFFPDFRKWISPQVGFDWKFMIKREYSSFFGMISAFVILKFFTELLGEGKFEIGQTSIVFFIIGLTVYYTVHYMRKKTQILNNKSN